MKFNIFNMNFVCFCFVLIELFFFSGWKFFVKKIFLILYEEIGNFFGSFFFKIVYMSYDINNKFNVVGINIIVVCI